MVDGYIDNASETTSGDTWGGEYYWETMRRNIMFVYIIRRKGEMYLIKYALRRSNRILFHGVDIFFSWMMIAYLYKLSQSYSSITVNREILEHKEIMAISLLRVLSKWEVCEK